MKKLLLMLVILALAGLGCTTNQSSDDAIVSGNPLEQASIEMDKYATVLACDWPRASAAIREGLGVENLPKGIVDQLDRIDKLFKKEDGSWMSRQEISETSDYDRWSAAFARLRQTGPVMKAIIEVHSPGLLLIPEVATVLTFMGLGAL